MKTEIINLRTNNYSVPLTVEDEKPAFSWEMDSKVIGQKQDAYQITVTKDSDNSESWDTNMVACGMSNNIYYSGAALEPETAYTWNLKVWDTAGQIYTQTSKFETGMMNPDIAAWNGAV